jgi:hypothetical protein
MQRPTRTKLVPLLMLGGLLGLGLAACGDDSGEVRDVASLGTDAAGADEAGDGTGDATDDGAETDASDGDVSEADMQDAQVRFSRCMREHGIDIPDPGADGGVMIQIDENTDPSEIQAAEEACRPILEEVIGSFAPPSPEEMEQMREQMLEFTRCMREHGIDMPDPEFGENGTFTVGAGPAEAGPPMNDDDFAAATEACDFGPGGGGFSVNGGGPRAGIAVNGGGPAEGD